MKTSRSALIRVVGVGAGGHARVLLEICRHQSRLRVVGLTAPAPQGHPSSIAGIRVLGGDDILPALYQQGVRHAFIGVGGVGDNAPRARLYSLLESLGFELINLVHPSAVLAEPVTGSRALAVMAGVLVNPGVHIGNNVILNTGCIVEHDCTIADHVHISPGAVLSGAVTVCKSAHVGAGASIKEGVRIGERALVGAGAVVVRDVAPDTVVAGVPARTLRHL